MQASFLRIEVLMSKKKEIASFQLMDILRRFC